jgi:succinylarginine dihydrolase
MVKEYQAELEAMDADHADKLNQVQDFYQNKLAEKDAADAAMLKQYAEAVDKDHTKRLKTIFEAVSNDHAKKLNEAVDFVAERERNKKVDVLAESVEKYLNYALEQHLPKKQLVSEQKYQVATKALDKITDYLKVNGIIQESKDGIFKDYENQINSAKEKTEKLISENAKLNRKLQRKEAQMVL